MKKINIFITLSLLSVTLFAQKAILVNGGKFGDPNENVNVRIYDVSTKTSKVIDTVNSGSVQDILIEDTLAYVLAQDTIVAYNLKTESRVAAAKFPGFSTKAIAISGNELIVGNWYGLDSSNLYFYDKTDLSHLDTMKSISRRAKAILVHNGFAFVTQHSQTPNFVDTMGMIVRINIANRSITDTIEVASYSQDYGELIEMPDGTGFYSINSVSNTITSVDYTTLTATNTSFNHNFGVSSRSQMSIHNDTAFLRMNGGIGAINLSNLSTVDSLIVDTIITAFTYDTLNHNFYITQTNFSSYTGGRIFDRSGVRVDTLVVGFSPEVIEMYYVPTTTSLNELKQLAELTFSAYPNPTTSLVNLKIADNNSAFEIKVYNQAGQLLMNQMANSNQQLLDFSRLDKGLYIVQILTKEAVGIKRIIVQ